MHSCKISFLPFVFFLIFYSNSFSKQIYTVIAVNGDYAVIDKPEDTLLKIGDIFSAYRIIKNRGIFICRVKVDIIAGKYCRLKILKTYSKKTLKKGDFILINTQKQSQNIQLKNGHKWQIGIIIGSKIDATYDYAPNENLNWTKFTPEKSFGFSTGIQIDYCLNKILFLNLCPQFSYTKSEWYFKKNEQSINTSRVFNQIELPLTFKIKPGPLYFLAGINYIYVLSASNSSIENKNYVFLENINRSLLSYTVGTGFQLNISRSLVLLLESRFNYSPGNILKENDPHFKELYPGGFKIITGINYTLIK